MVGKNVFDWLFKEMRCPKCGKLLNFKFLYWRCDFCNFKVLEFWTLFSIVGWIMVGVTYLIAKKFHILGM